MPRTLLTDHIMNNIYNNTLHHLRPHSVSKKQKIPSLNLSPRSLSKALAAVTKPSPISENTLKLNQNITKLSGPEHLIQTSPIWVDGCLKNCHKKRNLTITSDQQNLSLHLITPETFRPQKTPEIGAPPYGLMGIE